jgi:hypothetical protein
MQQIHSSKVNIFSPNQGITRFLWNHMYIVLFKNVLPIVAVLRLINLLLALTPCFCKLDLILLCFLRLGLSSALLLLVVFAKTTCFSSPQMHNTTHLPSISLLDQPTSIRRGFVINLLFMKFKPVARHCLPLRYKYLPQHLILELSQPVLISHRVRSRFTRV